MHVSPGLFHDQVRLAVAVKISGTHAPRKSQLDLSIRGRGKRAVLLEKEEDAMLAAVVLLAFPGQAHPRCHSKIRVAIIVKIAELQLIWTRDTLQN